MIALPRRKVVKSGDAESGAENPAAQNQVAQNLD